MGRQYNKVLKRKRRINYVKRKNLAARQKKTAKVAATAPTA